MWSESQTLVGPEIWVTQALPKFVGLVDRNHAYCHQAQVSPPSKTSMLGDGSAAVLGMVRLGSGETGPHAGGRRGLLPGWLVAYPEPAPPGSWQDGGAALGWP